MGEDARGGAAGAGAPPAPAARDPVCQLVVEDLSADTVVLSGTEARHALASLRARVGDAFQATDGRGTRARLVVTRIGRHQAEARVEEPAWVPQPERRWWLATAARRGRFDWLVEKAVELGGWGLIPLGAGSAGAGSPGEARRSERWERLARAALGQCLGAWGAVIKPAADLRELLADGPGDGKPWTAVVWGEPAGTAALAIAPGRIPLGDVLLVIGPPQGFSERDRAALEAVARALPVSLAGRRLRSETAAVTALAWAALLDDHSVKSAGDCSSRG